MNYEQNHNKLIDAILSGCTENALLNKVIENVKDPKLFVEGTKDKSMSPVGACVVCGNMKLLDTLISHGAPVDFSGSCFRKYNVRSPVEVAIKSQQPDMLRRLLEAGACCSERDDYFCRAMFNSDKELNCFKILMKHIVDKNLITDGHWCRKDVNIDDCQEFSPFHAVLEDRGMHMEWEEDDLYKDSDEDIEEELDDVVKVVDILINLGFCLDTVVMTWMGLLLPEPDPEPEGAWSPLELAIMNKNCKSAALLIKAGSAIGTPTWSKYGCKENDCLLNDSLAYRTFELVQILVHAGAKVTRKHMEIIQKILNGEHIYTYREHDRNKKPSMELVEWLTKEESNPPSLKRLCRVMIRNYLREKTKGCTILPTIEQLEIPQHTKQYLALEIL